MKFRKKPVVIEAVQLRWDNWNEMCDHVDVGKLVDNKPEGCWIGSDDKPIPDQSKPDCTKDRLGILIPTLEGLMVGIQGDWIIKGVKGEFYPCKSDIFEATYEPVEEAMRPTEKIEERLTKLEEQVRVLNQSVILNPYRNDPPQFGHSGPCQPGCKCAVSEQLCPSVGLPDHPADDTVTISRKVAEAYLKVHERGGGILYNEIFLALGKDK